MKHLTLNILLVLLFALVGFFSPSCANIGTITGGDKDSIPPVMTASKPLLLDTGFNEGKIIIGFDEYFELKDVNQEFVASPPMKEKPDFKVKKKFLQVKFNEPLKDSVTYVLDFGDAIADFNEGNILRNFRFVFSTYSMVDSFSVSGIIKNAFDLKTPENTQVMVYTDYSDSIPFKSLPSYVSRIDSSGNFHIDHIKPGKYKVFAFADMNTNRKADDFEPRAFLDSLIVPLRILNIKTDSLKAGTIIHDIHDHNITDSLTKDSVIVTHTYLNKPKNIRLYQFAEDNLVQKIMDFTRPTRNRVTAGFQLPIDSGLTFNIINLSLDPKNLVIEKNINRDTVTFWINDSLLIKSDTILARIGYLKKDSLGRFVTDYDTLSYTFRDKPADDAWKRNQTAPKAVIKEYLGLSYLAKESKIDINKNLIIESPTPLGAIDTSRIKLFEIKDTVTTDPKEQKIEKAYRLKKDLLQFTLKRPIAGKFSIEPMNFKAENWISISPDFQKKVFTCQISDQAIASMDTLKMKVHFDNHFFLEQIQELTDTVILPISAQKILSRKRGEADKIALAFDRPQIAKIEVVPDDFIAKGNWYRVEKNRFSDSLTIVLTDKKISDKDTLTLSVKGFDYIGLKGDSIFFSETMRLIFRDKPQYLSSVYRPYKDEFIMVFNKSLKQLPEITPTSFTINNKWFNSNLSTSGDTIRYNITDDFVSDMDSLKFIISYSDINRKGSETRFRDTVLVISRQKIEIKPKAISDKPKSEELKSQTVHIYLPVRFSIHDDSLGIRRRIIKSDWKNAMKYQIRTDSMAFTDFYGLYNKMGSYDFSTRELDYYCKLNISLKNIRGLDKIESQADSLSTDSIPKEAFTVSPEELKKYTGDGKIILQLLTEKGELVYEYKISDDQEIKQDFLHPGNYRLKIIFDRNNNGKWDTGNYFKNIQPERVIIGGEPIVLKSGFENNSEWNVGESLIKSFTVE